MQHEYTVDGGVAGRIPGAYGPGELDGRAEWVPVRRDADLLAAVEARLGSESHLDRVVLAVLAPLRRALGGPPLDALLAALPLDLAREIRDAEANLCAPVPPPSGAGDYLVEVSRLLLHPPRHAARYVNAVFAAARGVLDPEDEEVIGARLPADIAALWYAAA